MVRYVPDRGDIIWISFDPQTGREPAGRRPAVVLTAREYNEKVGLALCCPITSRVKGYPFEVPLPDGSAIQGVVLSDHVKSLDWRARKAEGAGRVPDETLQEITGKLSALLSLSSRP
jgi:mRNA interferase MazF